MIPISADDLEFDAEAGGAVHADSLPFDFDSPKAGKPAPSPRKPVGKPSKKPRQPVQFTTPAIGPSEQEGYDFEVEGGVPKVKLNVKPSTSMDFRTPEVSIGSETPKAKLKAVKARRIDGESEDEFAIRQAKFEYGQKQSERQAKAERAAVRSKVQPDRWSASKALEGAIGKTGSQVIRGAFPVLDLVSEKYPIAAADGAAGVMTPIFGAIDRMDDRIETHGAFEPENQMPRLNAKESGEFGVKVASGLGSTIPFGLASALGGLPATAILGAASNAGQVYDEARLRGVSDQEALHASVPAAVIGSLEGLLGLGTGKFVEQMGKGTVKSLLGGIGEEEFQELTSQVLNNVNAKYLSGYDPKRALSEGMWETFTTTLGTAGLMHGSTMISPQQHSAQALESLPIAQQLEVGTALADPSPRSFASLPPRVREAAMLNWHMEADPRLKKEDGSPVELYHGTQSPTVIEEIDISKADPNGMYGPGFYMTQSSEVAAGEGGYALTKSNLVTAKEAKQSTYYKDLYKSYIDSGEYEGRHNEAENKALMNAINKLETEIPQKPHAYKLYANIRKPFDIDFNLSPEMQKEIFGVPLSRNSISGGEIYRYIVNQQGSKEKANSFLKEVGFDGITHIGGGRSNGTPFDTQAEAEAYAKQAGGRVIPPVSPIIDSNNRVANVSVVNGDKWTVDGHRVWIALDEANVKSAWSREFDPQNPKIQASLKPNELQAMKQRALDVSLDSPEAESTDPRPMPGIDPNDALAKWRQNTGQSSTSLWDKLQQANEKLQTPLNANSDAISIGTQQLQATAEFLGAINEPPKGLNGQRSESQIQRIGELKNKVDLLQEEYRRLSDIAASEWARPVGKGVTSEEGQLQLGPVIDIVPESRLKGNPVFLPSELKQMEQRSTKAGKPLALTPETRDAYTARNQEIKTQLLTVDPSSPEFARLADEHTRLARAIDDSPAIVPQSAEELRQHLIQMNMGHEGAAQEMLDILRPPSGDSPLKLNIDKFQAARQSSIQGARFYPLNNETKGGSVYVTPQTFNDSGLIEKGQHSEIGAVNVPLDEARNAAARLQESQPDVTAALVAAVKEAEAKGISKISVLSYAEGQGLGETRKLMRHESFHSGQQAAAEAADAMGIDPRDLHSPDLIYNPLVGKAAQSENGQAILKYYDGNQNDFALEMAAYSAADQHDYFGWTKEEAASYLTDYLTGIADQYGPEALDALAGTARLSPSVDKQVKEISSNAKPKENFGQANRDFAAQLRTQPSSSGGPPGFKGRSEGSGSVDEGRVAEGGDQDEVGRVVGGKTESEGVGAPPTDSGNGRVIDKENPLFTTVLTSDVVKEYAKKSGEALRKLGLLDEDSLLPPHEQILKVLKERPDLAEPAALGAALREQGVTGEETLKQIDEAAANAGRTLQAIQAADAEWTQLIKQYPEVAAELSKAGVGPKPEKIIQQGLKEMQSSILGRSLWRRSGDLFRKTLLTRFSTAANNAISTLPRIPLDLVDGIMTGTAMGMLQPKKWTGKSDATLAEGAKAGALAGMQASARVAMAFPDAARRIFKRAAPAHEFNEMVIAQMEQLHPDLHSKLEGRSTGLDEFKESSVKLDTLRNLLPHLNDGAKFKEYSAKLDMYQKRYDFNHKLAGKLFDKTNWVYDLFLKPGNAQEFFFRRPYFVGALANRAAAAGFDLSELAINAGTLKDFAADPGGKDAQAIMQLRTLADLPPDVWEAAADDALTFTYAYNPHRDRGGVEKFASHYIEFMDSLGPVGAVVDAFPKAVYNGLKFAYEYGPVGMIKPVANITDNVYQGGGRKGIQYNDVSRISKALLGTAMYATAIGIRKELGGEEWWQIKTGKKNAKGEPEYLNVKKWMPFAGFLYVADLILRMKNGRMIDKKPGDDMAELYLGARRADSGGTVFSESIKEVADYWASGDPLDDTLLNKAGKPLGNILGAPLTPFINLRDLIAQFDEDEAARRDMKESPFLGPAIDKIPWLRSSEKYGLPLYQPPTELAPRPSSSQPALTLSGVAMDPGSNFITREFSRLGLSPVHWLRPDPDPLINSAQYASYAELLGELAKELENDPTYVNASQVDKLARLEEEITGSKGVKGIAQLAKADGLEANPDEVERRELLKTQKPFEGKASGLYKEVQDMKKKPAAVPRP